LCSARPWRSVISSTAREATTLAARDIVYS
jgi:hypothetical protein